MARAFILVHNQNASIIRVRSVLFSCCRWCNVSLVLFSITNWHPDMLQRRHPELEKSFDLVENEKYAILGKPSQDL